MRVVIRGMFVYQRNSGGKFVHTSPMFIQSLWATAASVGTLGTSHCTPALDATGLLRWALHGSVRAKDAAITRLRLKHYAAALALVEILARVHGHPFSLRMPTGWTRDNGLQYKHYHAPTPYSRFALTKCRLYTRREADGVHMSPPSQRPRPPTADIAFN